MKNIDRCQEEIMSNPFVIEDEVLLVYKHGIMPKTTSTHYNPPVRTDENGRPNGDGKYMIFGSYPNTLVRDDGLKAELDTLSGAMPQEPGSKWLSYEYILGNDMWYIDLSYAEHRYRGVFFLNYRNQCQKENGYMPSKSYWFKYEPIKWRILTEDGQKSLLLSELLLDSHEYYDNTTTRLDGEYTVYPNNYKFSNIRAWLNNAFYNTAFGDCERERILLANIDNNGENTTDELNSIPQATKYICADTRDRVFLLSAKDVTVTSYGFAPYARLDAARRKQITDYAAAQGAYNDIENGWWWLRSPYFGDCNSALNVNELGRAACHYGVNNTRGGVCPALWIAL